MSLNASFVYYPQERSKKGLPSLYNNPTHEKNLFYIQRNYL